MIEVAWHSQSFPPEGASAAEGIRNQLGRPELDMLTILVREAAQNSWDARASDTEPVQFDISLRDIGPAQLPAWRAALQPPELHTLLHPRPLLGVRHRRAGCRHDRRERRARLTLSPGDPSTAGSAEHPPTAADDLRPRPVLERLE